MDLDSQAVMKNHLGIQPNAFEPVYSEGEHVSDSKDSDLEGNSDSEGVGNTDWCGCEVCVLLSERERIICNIWDILEEKLDVENIDCEKQHMEFDIT